MGLHLAASKTNGSAAKLSSISAAMDSAPAPARIDLDQAFESFRGFK
jgi:hypothetical protein